MYDSEDNSGSSSAYQSRADSCLRSQQHWLTKMDTHWGSPRLSVRPFPRYQFTTDSGQEARDTCLVTLDGNLIDGIWIYNSTKLTQDMLEVIFLQSGQDQWSFPLNDELQELSAFPWFLARFMTMAECQSSGGFMALCHKIHTLLNIEPYEVTKPKAIARRQQQRQYRQQKQQQGMIPRHNKILESILLTSDLAQPNVNFPIPVTVTSSTQSSSRQQKQSGVADPLTFHKIPKLRHVHQLPMILADMSWLCLQFNCTHLVSFDPKNDDPIFNP
jgi:hypothetical protein